MFTVTMVRKGFDDRECRVRVTDAALAEERRERNLPADRDIAKAGGNVVAWTAKIDRIRDDLARSAAVRRWFGRSRVWIGELDFPHRGQVWQSAKGGGQDAVTGMITLRVS